MDNIRALDQAVFMRIPRNPIWESESSGSEIRCIQMFYGFLEVPLIISELGVRPILPVVPSNVGPIFIQSQYLYIHIIIHYIELHCLCMCLWCVFMRIYTGVYRSILLKVYQSFCIDVYTVYYLSMSHKRPLRHICLSQGADARRGSAGAQVHMAVCYNCEELGA